MALHNQSLSISAPKVSLLRPAESVAGCPEKSVNRDSVQQNLTKGGEKLQDNIPLNYRTTTHTWVWWNSLTSKLNQAQMVAFSIIIICQLYVSGIAAKAHMYVLLKGFVLTKFGIPVFNLLIGTGMWIPLIFVVVLLHGLYTHDLPMYWRISTSIITQAGTSQITFLLVVKDIINMCRIQSMNAYFLDAWVAWIVIVAATITVSLISFVLVIKSLRDILRIKIKPVTGDLYLTGEEYTV